MSTQEALAPVMVNGVVANLHDLAAEEADRLPPHRDPVRLANADLARRLQRVRSDAGREVALRLPSGSAALRTGDVLAVVDETVLVVEPLASDVVVIAPRTVFEAGQVAHTLGNRHLQMQFFGGDSEIGRRFGGTVFLTPYDHTVADHLAAVECPHERAEVTLEVPFRHAGHTH